MQGDVIGAEGLEQGSNEPEKQGLSVIHDNSTTQFCPHQNFVDQILSLFDRLEMTQQRALLETLTVKIQKEERNAR